MSLLFGYKWRDKTGMEFLIRISCDNEYKDVKSHISNSLDNCPVNRSCLNFISRPLLPFDLLVPVNKERSTQTKLVEGELFRVACVV